MNKNDKEINASVCVRKMKAVDLNFTGHFSANKEEANKFIKCT